MLPNIFSDLSICDCTADSSCANLYTVILHLFTLPDLAVLLVHIIQACFKVCL